MALDGRATLAPSASLIQLVYSTVQKSTAQCKDAMLFNKYTVQCASTHCVSANVFHKYSCVSVKAYKYEMLG